MSADTGSPRPPVYRFGACELDIARRELRRDGALVALQPKVFELLAYLVEHRDRAVDKSEIQDAVWPRVIVTETSLTQAIRKARRAVGDDANTQSVIRTVHGHGYRFVAPLVESAEDAAGSVATSVPAVENVSSAEVVATRPPATPRLRSPYAWLGAVGIVLLIAFLWVLRPTPLSASDVRVAVLPVDNRTGDPDLEWTRLGLMSLAGSLLAAADLSLVADADVVRIAADSAMDDGAAGVTSARLRQAYGATHVLTARLERQAGLMRFGFTLTDTAGHTVRETMVGEEPIALVRAAVQRVLERLGRSSGSTVEHRLISDDPFVNEAYARGRALALEGRCNDAQALFRAAISQGPDLFEPRYEYAVCARVLGAWQEAETLYAQLVDEETSRGSGRPLARSLAGLGIVYDRTGRMDLADHAYKRAAEAARPVGDAVLSGDIAVNQSILAENLGDFARARELLGRAMNFYQEAGLEVVPGSLYNTMANVAMEEGDLTEADHLIGQAVESFRAVGDRRREALAINNRGYLRAQQGRYEEAIALHQESAAIREELGDRVGLAWVNNLLAVSLIELGRLDEAERAAQLSLDIAEDAGERLLEATSHARLGEIALQRNALEPAAQRFVLARSIFADIDDALRVELVDLKLARIALLHGQPESARATAATVLEAARGRKFKDPEIEALQLLGDVAASSADPVTFEARYREAIERAREVGNSGKLSELRIHLAGHYLERGQLEDADSVLGLLAEVPDSASLLRLRAEHAYRRGDPHGASQLMERARTLAGQRWSDRDAQRLAMYAGAGT